MRFGFIWTGCLDCRTPAWRGKLASMRLALAIVTLFATLVVPAFAEAQAPPSCQFVLGFATMAQAVPKVGQCLENQHFAANGDAQQQTSGGLLVWRKADNWTAFTDGNMTWINGPMGLQNRLNTDLLPWEQTSFFELKHWTGSDTNGNLRDLDDFTITSQDQWAIVYAMTSPSPTTTPEICIEAVRSQTGTLVSSGCYDKENPLIVHAGAGLYHLKVGAVAGTWMVGVMDHH